MAVSAPGYKSLQSAPGGTFLSFLVATNGVKKQPSHIVGPVTNGHYSAMNLGWVGNT